MFAPERMTLAEIACDPEIFPEVIDVLHRSGAAEIEKSSSLTDRALNPHPADENSIRYARELESRFKTALDYLEAPLYADTPSPFLISEAMRIAAENAVHADEIIGTFTELRSLDIDIASEKKRAELLSWLASVGIDPGICHSGTRIDVTCGLLEKKAGIFPTDDSENILRITGVADGGIFIVIASESSSDYMTRLKKNPDFIPIDCAHPVRDIASLETIRNGLLDVTHTYATLVPQLQKARTALISYLAATEQISRCADTGYCAHIACWIPSRSSRDVIEGIHTRFSERCAVRQVSAETAIRESRFTHQSVPSRLTRSEFLEPFRVLVSAYSWPVYGYTDPTAISALFFLIFFGMMFADIGHGAVLALIGVILRTVTSGRSLRNAGTLMIHCGASSVIGGFLFGSVFGREEIVNPVLFNPSAHIGMFLSVGTGIGVVVLSAGIVFNIIQTLRNRRIPEAFFSQWGLLSLVFYWLCVWIVSASFSPSLPEPPVTAIISIIALPLVLMTAGDLIIGLIRGHADIPEIAFRPVETALGLLSNTVSFVRIAAFGLCHIALMSAVYIIASSQPDSPAYFISVSIEGNIFVILLEALIVTIQCVRLQFYEFYSKFFVTGGRRFIPVGSITDKGEDS